MQISYRLDKELETQILARGQFKCVQESDGILLKTSLSDRVDPTVLFLQTCWSDFISENLCSKTMCVQQ